mgnify:CR=1 FL=1
MGVPAPFGICTDGCDLVMQTGCPAGLGCDLPTFGGNHSGAASGADVLELVRRVRARVRQVKGVDLQPEVLLYGRRWEDVL